MNAAEQLIEVLSGDYDPDWWNESGVEEVVAELRRLEAENNRLRHQETELLSRLAECSWRSSPDWSQPAQQPVNQWVKVTDQMPPPDTRLLVLCGPGSIAETAHTFGKWKHPSHPLGYLIGGHGGSHSAVTHWMPLPSLDDPITGGTP